MVLLFILQLHRSNNNFSLPEQIFLTPIQEGNNDSNNTNETQITDICVRVRVLLLLVLVLMLLLAIFITFE